MGIFSGALSLGSSLLSTLLAHTSANNTNEINRQNVLATNKSNESIADRANYFNRQIAEDTNRTNAAIAQENLQYQRELQEYQKSLQQKQWEREDTAYQRTAQDMLAAGLNPLDMQGTDGAGEVVSMSPLENTFQAQQSAPMVAHKNESFRQADAFQSAMSATSAFSTIAEAFNQIETGNLQRDSLRLENEKKEVENYLLARSHGVYNYHAKGFQRLLDNDTSGGKNYMSAYMHDIPKADLEWLEYSNALREYNHKVGAGIYDTDTDFERVLTAIQDWIANGRGEEAYKKLEEKFPILKAFK